MRTRGDLDLGAAIDRRHLDRASQQGGRHGDIEVVDQVVAVAQQLLVLLLLDQDLQIAVHAAVAGRITLARDGQHHTLAYTGRNLDLDHLLTALGTLTAALVALGRDHLPLATAGRADRLHLHTAEEGVLHRHHIARAVAVRAGTVRRAVLRTRAAALVAGNRLIDFELLRHARCDLLQRKAHLDTDIRAAIDRTTATRGAESAAEVAAKDVAKLREDILHREAAKAATEAACTTCGAVHAGMAELVVAGALIGVRQHIVGFGCLLELLLGLLIPRVLVGVILDSRLAVGLLYLVGIGVFLDAQHLVVVSLFCHLLTLLQQPLRSATRARPDDNPSAHSRSPCPSAPRRRQNAPRPRQPPRRTPCRSPQSPSHRAV